MIEKKSEQQDADVGIFTVVRHDDKVYCIECFLHIGGQIEDAEPLDMERWDSKSPPQCSLCLKKHVIYFKRDWKCSGSSYFASH